MFKLIFIFAVVNFTFVDGFDAYVTSITYNPSKYINGTYQIKNVTEGQIMNISIWLGEDLGQDNEFSVTIQKQFQKKSKTVFTLPGTGVCDAFWTYSGRTAMEVAKLSRINNPGKCPIAKGTYHIKNYLFQFSAISLLGMIPNGKYVAVGKMFDITGKQRRGDITIHFVKVS